MIAIGDTILLVMSGSGVLIAAGGYITTLITHGKRITRLEEKEYCSMHGELCKSIRDGLEAIKDDTHYLRNRLDTHLNNH